MKNVYTLEDVRRWEKTARGIEPPIRLGVIGNPVAHSLSPEMQNAALRECGIEMQYARFEIAPHDLQQALALMSANNFLGANITIPHKQAAVELVDQIDEQTRRIGAVNTLLFQANSISAFNTDAAGFIRAVHDAFGVDLRDLRVMLLGAGGGTGRTIAYGCAIERCERLVLVNRTPDKAAKLRDELAARFAEPKVLGPSPRLQSIDWNEESIRAQIGQIDLVVNATPLGLNRRDPSPFPSNLIAPHLMIFDVTYGPHRTALREQATMAGARYANGLPLLLHQGALAFEIWFNREAPIDAMRRALQEFA